ncbi:MAG: DUF3662 domain-containing protein [Intrasporangiaceae bacterium]|nr:DUF3662 domain-containing protein [Intrasporangiaceae bacterium]
MGIFDRVERRLERTVNGVFARAFKAEVQPVEISSAIRKAMDDRAVTPSRGHVLVPNVFTVVLSPTDHERLSEFEDDIIDELVVSAEEHVDSQRYAPAGPITIHLERADDLETGIFRIKPSKAKGGRRHEQHGQQSRDDRGDQVNQDNPYAPRRSPAASRPAAGEQRREESFNPYGMNPYDGDYADPLAGAPGESGPSHSAGGGSRPAPTREEPRPVAPRRSRPGDRPYLAARDDRFLLMGPINVIGRDEENDIIFDDPGISRRHSEIRVTTDGPHLKATVRDLGSTNGTFVNGERISSQRLEDGDRVTFGRTTVTFHAGRS